MRYGVTVGLLILGTANLAGAQTAATPPVQIRLHYIGEPVSRFLKLEVDAREEVNVCEDHADRVDCIHLLNAVQGNGRTEISTSIPPDLFHLTDSDARDSVDFVLDGGKLARLNISLNETDQVLNMLGQPSSESDIPAQNADAKWTNHLSIWDRPTVYVTIFQDNNPALSDHRPVLVMESPEEHLHDVGDSNKATTAQSH